MRVVTTPSTTALADTSNDTPVTAVPDKDFHARIREASNLPSPTAVAARLIEIADDPDLSMTMVVEVLRTDPALSAKLLRLANSPLYRGGGGSTRSSKPSRCSASTP